MIKPDPHKPFKEAPQYIQLIMKEVLKLETDVLHQNRPRLKSEIIQIIKEAVKDEA
ncbi:hypothetical protein ACOMICROBIO_FLGHMIGD_01766 [Vibrio sp. B1FLJ16]|uniref:hypothetical protein n=1 Tax=Vibrio sp. B1FLJ16 TaxID=2751178 RepID=UPI0015F4D7C9|nr:hypothetical protein [Vibrio sp. B1FLJ16]CAD7808020.1 hypothetical protein ACOMICROBIO_FLGHMIGD_01766 [Vibrio sp. B1FLJ16]CAE6906046.1 hypothetical protein ACOMICROBIO_FLGHMIGD_01766 [Vibrio sp. B1FLJ16]